MAISDCNAMHRMPAASSAAAGTTSPSSTTNSTIRPSKEKKWHFGDSSGGSTLSRSMRYADPWLNCTGTGGGKYGTVRCHSSSYSQGNASSSRVQQQQQRRAGTVRVSGSSSNGGASLLTSTVADPYDLVRRSRLGRSVSPDGRSSSFPSYNNNVYMCAYATYGRRSILECDVNPYDLMENHQDEDDASITCVNGQRIRVRPSLANIHYQHEHIQHTPNSNSQIHKTNKCNNSSADGTDSVIGSTNIGTTAHLTFKSILKKKATNTLLTSTLNDCNDSTSPTTDSFNSSSSSMTFNTSRKMIRMDQLDKHGYDNKLNRKAINPSKSTTQFYIPMPSNCMDGTGNDTNSTIPRKKVQFLMSPDKSAAITNEEYCSYSNNNNNNEMKEIIFNEYYSTHDDYLEDDCTDRIDSTNTSVPHQSLVVPPPSSSTSPSTPLISEFSINTLSSSSPTTICRFLQRSTSERFNANQLTVLSSTASNVVFHDTMALRSRGTNVKDTRTLFSINAANTPVPVRLCSSTDLERLDGVSRSKSKKHVVMRPVAPPPPRPSPTTKATDQMKLVDVTSSPVVPPRKRSYNNKQPSLPPDSIIKISHRIQIRNPELTPEGAPNNNVNTISVTSPMDEVPPSQSPSPQITTSILIGADDHCYSTVNVNGDDCHPHYRSSVVVVGKTSKNGTNQSYSSSKVYIISNCGEDCSGDVSEHNLVPYDEVYNVSTNVIEVDGTNKSNVHEGYEDVINIAPKYEDIIYADGTIDEPTTQCMELSSELLQSLLCDPVEAVRRNLVPHVCGKDIHITNAICHNRRLTNQTKQYNANNNSLSRAIDDDDQQSVLPSPSPSPMEECNNVIPVVVDVSKEQDNSNSNTCMYDGDDGTAQYEPLNDMCSTTSSECYTDSNRSSITEDELHGRNSKFYELLADATLAEVTSDLDLELDMAYNRCTTTAISDNAPGITQHADCHHYESIITNKQQQCNDPIYEDIDLSGGANSVPPPLPAHPPPPQLLDDLNVGVEYTTRSIFEGASKYDILSYLVDAKERGCATVDAEETAVTSRQHEQEESYCEEGVGVGIITLPVAISPNSTIDRDNVGIADNIQPINSLMSSLAITTPSTRSAEIERNDSGVGSETSKCSLSKYRSIGLDGITTAKTTQNCEDCNDNEQDDSNDDVGVLTNSVTNINGNNASQEDPVSDALQPLLCKRCTKRRVERREIIMEIVETEEKYMRDLQITLEEFYHPMLIAGLLTPDQLQAIFLNIEELLDNSTLLSDRLRDTVDMAIEQGDEDLLQVDIGRLFLDAGFQMLHAFELYCIRQGGAALLLAGLEKEKELLRVFLRVSQMENVVLRRMNLSSFLMVPVQRVTKYPLLLARLYKVTAAHHEDCRSRLHEAQHTIEVHLNHINSQTHNIPTKLWRRLNSTTSTITNNTNQSNGTNGKLSSVSSGGELIDLVAIKLRKIAVDALDWNHEEATFVMEGRLLVTQPQVEGHHQWRKGRTIKLSPVCAMLVTCGGGGGGGRGNSINRKGGNGRRHGRKLNNAAGFGGKMLGKLNGAHDPMPTTDNCDQQQQQQQELMFPARQRLSRNNPGTGAGKSVVREAALLLLRDKGGRHSLLREPLYLDRCVVAADPAWQSYFEVQELHHTMHSATATNVNNNSSIPGSGHHHHHHSSSSPAINAPANYGNSTYIFRADDDAQTRMWYKQLQYYAQGMGAWRRRRNALPNIMIAGLGLR